MRIRAMVSGKVQGVFFRANTAELARRLEISGWVRNLDNGMVEVVAEGEKDSIEKLVAFLRKGPAGARVDGLKIEEYKGKLNKVFRIV
jgi:acylphosphatase